MSSSILHIGLLCAMSEEIGNFLDNLCDISENQFGDLTIYSGIWKNSDTKKIRIRITLAWSGWGKVSVSRATTRLISYSGKEKLDICFFTGVAGAAKKEINQWDIVIPEKLIQHDMDARPLFKKYEIPALNKKFLFPSKLWIEWCKNSISNAILSKKLKKFKNIHTGLVATGDSFISDESILKILKKNLPDLEAVEMEGAAFAQVACQEKIPWLVIRVISDNADGSAAQNFNDFLNEYKYHSNYLLKELINNISNSPLDKNYF